MKKGIIILAVLLGLVLSAFAWQRFTQSNAFEAGKKLYEAGKHEAAVYELYTSSYPDLDFFASEAITDSSLCWLHLVENQTNYRTRALEEVRDGKYIEGLRSLSYAYTELKRYPYSLDTAFFETYAKELQSDIEQAKKKSLSSISAYMENGELEKAYTQAQALYEFDKKAADTRNLAEKTSKVYGEDLLAKKDFVKAFPVYQTLYESKARSLRGMKVKNPYAEPFTMLCLKQGEHYLALAQPKKAVEYLLKADSTGKDYKNTLAKMEVAEAKIAFEDGKKALENKDLHEALQFFAAVKNTKETQLEYGVAQKEIAQIEAKLTKAELANAKAKASAYAEVKYKLESQLKGKKSYTVILKDINFGVKSHKYQIISNTGGRPTSTETELIKVSDSTFAYFEGDEGMEILNFNNGKAQENTSPVGYGQYVGNEEYGEWRESDEGSFWEFYGRYAFMSTLLGLNSPIYRDSYRSYNRYYRGKRSYYGSLYVPHRSAATHSPRFQKAVSKMENRKSFFYKKSNIQRSSSSSSRSYYRSSSSSTSPYSAGSSSSGSKVSRSSGSSYRSRSSSSGGK